MILDASGELASDWQVMPSGLVVPGHCAKRLTCVDLFCGCGGFSLGMLQAGYHVVAGADWEPDAAVTYLTNLGADRIDLRFASDEDRDRFEQHLQKAIKRSSKGVVKRMPYVSGCHRDPSFGPPGWQGVPAFWFGDLSKVSGAQILESVGLRRGELDCMVGGPPCQGFSHAGKREVADPRNNLVFEYARLICEMQPRTMVMENVPGILSMRTTDGRSVVDEFCRILERGDFGEFSALREALTGERRAVRRRTERTTALPDTSRPELPDEDEEPAQQSLFGVG